MQKEPRSGSEPLDLLEKKSNPKALLDTKGIPINSPFLIDNLKCLVSRARVAPAAVSDIVWQHADFLRFLCQAL